MNPTIDVYKRQVLGLSRASSPCPVVGWVESRGREGGVGTPLPASGPAERPCTLKASRKLPRKASLPEGAGKTVRF